jgi:aspartate aminotransferase
VQSQVKACIRANYSNPPAHGAERVTTVLGEPALRKQWEGEVSQMRDRINGMRQLLVKTLQAKGVPGDYSFITRQRGMFSFSGLTPQQVKALKEKYAIYVVGSGRINVAGITADNVGPLCEAIADVVKG